MEEKYSMEFTQTITHEGGIIDSKVYLSSLKLTVNGCYRVVDKINLGYAKSEKEASQIVDNYLLNNLSNLKM